MKQTQILIRLPKDLKEALEKLAKREKRSLNNLVNIILEREVRNGK